MSLLNENRLSQIFRSPGRKLSIYLTAGYPKLNDTVPLLGILQNSGIDFVEIGIPFSDSIMDGPVILNSHQVGLDNGMTLDVLFDQLAAVRAHISIPIVLMGSMNPVYQYGFDRFCRQCKKVGVDGLLLPDLPITEFKKHYSDFYRENNLAPVFMISPQTSNARLAEIDEVTEGFLYAVSSSSTTGASSKMEDSQAYFEQLQNQNFRNPVVIGFNIKTREDISFVSQYADGVIVGSAFIQELEGGFDPDKITGFIAGLKD